MKISNYFRRLAGAAVVCGLAGVLTAPMPALARTIGYLYAEGHSTPNLVDALAVSDTGGLSRIGTGLYQTFGSAAPVSGSPTSLRIATIAGTPYLYAANTSPNSISRFTVDRTTGALTWVGNTSTGGVSPGSLAIAPDESCLFVAGTGGTIQRYSLSSAGVPSLAGTTTTPGATTRELQVSPDGLYLLAVLNSTGSIASYSIGTSCALTAVVGSPFAVAQINLPYRVEFDPDGSRVFMPADATLYTFNFSAGVLSAGTSYMSASPVACAMPNGTGDRLWTGAGSQISGLAVAADGSLSLLPGSPLGTGDAPRSFASTQDQRFLFAATPSSNTITSLSTAADGTPAVVDRMTVGGFAVDSLVYLPLCNFDGVVDALEECDDGNLDAGDGCASCSIETCWSCEGAPSVCTLQEEGASCEDDGDVCTDDSCDGAGTCVHDALPEGSSCDDADECSLGDTCQSGSCVSPDSVTCCDGGTCDFRTGSCGGCPAGYTYGNGGCQKRYYVTDDSQLIGLNSVCSSDRRRNTCGNDGVAATGNAYGFRWTDTAGSEVGPMIDLEFYLQSAGSAVPTASHSLFINNTPYFSFRLPPGLDCNVILQPPVHIEDQYAFPPYTKGGVNTAMTGTPSNCESIAKDPDGNYVVVVVTFEELAVVPPSVSPCDDGFGCTNDACDAIAGCSHTNNTNACDDAEVCTVGDVCSGGVCTPGPTDGCDDGNPCTDDFCEPGSGCSHADNTASCDDGNACTTGDVCSAGVCSGGAPTACDDGNPCTDDTCAPASGCAHANNGATCDDGNACTTSDFCAAGTCTGGAPPSCDDSSICTRDSCSPAVGCVHDSTPASGCFAAAKSSFSITASATDAAKNAVQWKISGGDAVSQADLGNPVSTRSYALCVYDETAFMASLTTEIAVGPGSAWVSKDPKGFDYKDKGASQDGVTKLQLKTGVAGKSKAALSAKGSAIPMPSAASATQYFHQNGKVIVQLVNDETFACWTSEFTAAKKNTGTQFKATAP